MVLKQIATVFSLSGLMLVSLPSLGAMQCNSGLTRANLSGTVTTINVSPVKQAGQICLNLTGASDGRELMNQCGAILGRTLTMNPQTGASTLTHTAVFNAEDLLVTRNDRAQITRVLEVDPTGAPCAFEVVETISELDKSGGMFKNAQIDVTATGTVSFCPNRNLNTFALQGEICVKK